MVSNRDRGQLILIGALTIALLLIGIAFVVNAVLFTENVQPSDSGAQLDNAEDIGAELRSSVQSLSVRVNHGSRDHSQDDLTGWVSENVTTLSHLYEESYLSAGSIAVNVTYNASGSRNATRLVQAADGEYVDGGNRGDWQPVRSGGNQRIGWAVINLNVTRSSDQRFHANFTDEDSEYVNMTFIKSTGPRGFDVYTSTSAGGSTTTHCTPRSERVLLNLHQGGSYTDDSCTFNGTTELDNTTTVDFEGGQNVEGKYSFVSKESNYGAGGGCPPASDDEPCVSPVVWNANVDVTITGDGFDLTSADNISVYPGGG